MAFLLPTTFQKRLVRYVLSQLSFLDMVSFDLDRLEGAWGRKTTGEIRDVPFKIDKLTELLKLPAWVKIKKADVRSLRLTVPLNIWSEGIEILVDGVDISCSVEEERSKEKGPQRGARSNLPRDPRQRTHDPGGEEHGGLPSVEEMAQSFVDHQPEDEKEKLRNEIAQQANMEDSSSSLDEDELGLGTQFSLPAVMADFLWGIGERLKIKVKNVKFEVDFAMDMPALGLAESSADKIAFRLTVDSIELQGVQMSSKDQNPETQHAMQLGNHRVVVTNVQGFIVSEPTLFAAFSAMSVPPSPTATHAGSVRQDDASVSSRSMPGSDISGDGSGSSNPASMTDSQELAMSASTILDAPPDMFRSMYRDDTDAALSDLSDTPDYLRRSMTDSQYHGFGSEAGISQFDECSSPDQSFLENGQMESPGASIGALEESQTLPHPKETVSPAARKIDESIPSIARSDDMQTSSNTLPPSQLLEIATNREQESSFYPSKETPDDMAQSIFHDFPENEALDSSTLDSSIFHDSRSQTDSISSKENQVLPAGKIMSASQETATVDGNAEGNTEVRADDLTQSLLFSREEAQSIYMSAMDDGQAGQSTSIHVPGGWGQESMYSEAEGASTPVRDSFLKHHRNDSDATIHGAASLKASSVRSSMISSAQERRSGGSESNVSPKSQYETRKALRKRFLLVEAITIEVPMAFLRSDRPLTEQVDPIATSSHSRPSRMPGEMSMFDDTLSRLERSTMRASFATSRQESFGSDVNESGSLISLKVDSMELTNDMGLVKLLIALTQQMLANRPTSTGSEQSPTDAAAGATPAWNLKVESFSWALVDSMESQLDSSLTSETETRMFGNSVLLVTRIKNFDVQHKQQHVGSLFAVSVGQYTMGFVDEAILSFDTSTSLEKSGQPHRDISVKVYTSPGMGPDIKVSTSPLRVTLDLRKLDEAFGWFGGLSGMIGLSNSVISTTTIMEPKRPVKPTRVRFDAPGSRATVEERPVGDSTAARITAVVNGVSADVLGHSSSLHLKTSPMKLVQRPEGLRMQIDKLDFTGPVIYDSEDEPPISLRFGPLKLAFLQTPKEQDLGRLLGLLSPSAQRQEEADDDVLVDTLIRQRRKGGVLRLHLEALEGRIERLEELEHLKLLGDELKKLATVTKYLPEDDRPGVMVLSTFQNIHVDLEVNPQIGVLAVEASNVEIACVTMPFLFLLGVDNIEISREHEKLVGSLLLPYNGQAQGRPSESSNSMPMILAKFIGNDLEPTVKVRLTNLCAEYHVTTLMAIMGIHETASGEVVVAEMIHSVANLAQTTVLPTPPLQNLDVESKPTSSKPFKLNLRFRECALGLNPRRSSAKGLLVLTDTQLETALPNSDTSPVDATLALNKISFLVVDDIMTLKGVQDPFLSGATVAPGHASATTSLSRMGYVPAADLSKASLDIKLSAKDISGERTMDVEVLDELFVLDSCADSTQTMIAIFSGLSPPTPPSTELKYRTEIMPVEDMLNSIAGEMPVPEVEDDKDSFGESSGGTVSYDFAKQLGYAVPDVDEADAKASKDSVTTREKRSKLNFDDGDFFARRQTAWGGTALEFNSNSNKYQRASKSKISKSPLRIRVKNINFHWNLYDGFDWQHTRNVIGEAVADVEKRAAARKASRRHSAERSELEEESVIGDFLFNSVYIGVGAKDDPRELARQVNQRLADDDLDTASYTTPTTVISNTTSARSHLTKSRRRHLRLERSKHHKITIQLNGVSADVVVFPPGSGETQTSIVLRVHDLEIFDHIKTSTWKKFATYMHDFGPRDVGTPMALIELLNVKPVPDLPASELILRVNILPLRLHVDQDALDFITRFFEFKDSGREGSGSPATPGEEPFIQRFEIFAVPVKLDFKPKRVDYGGLRSGKTTEFMNFVTLDGSDMVLDHIIMYGVSGFERLGKMLNDIWMPAIKQNQLPGVLAGIAPVRGIVNVGSGMKDLVMVPWQEYRKDGRLMRAIQKGAFAFAKNTTTELTKLGARVALGTQTVLQNAEDMLTGSPGSSDPPSNPRNTPGADEDRPQQISPYADQPLGVLAGLRGAYRHLERDMLYAKDAVIAMPGEVRESGSASGAARAVLRSAPTVVLRPAMGVTRALGTAFMGATNALDKDERRRTEDVSLNIASSPSI